jgi:hypothetical protein
MTIDNRTHLVPRKAKTAPGSTSNLIKKNNIYSLTTLRKGVLVSHGISPRA